MLTNFQHSMCLNAIHSVQECHRNPLFSMYGNGAYSQAKDVQVGKCGHDGQLLHLPEGLSSTCCTVTASCMGTDLGPGFAGKRVPNAMTALLLSAEPLLCMADGLETHY